MTTLKKITDAHCKVVQDITLESVVVFINEIKPLVKGMSEKEKIKIINIFVKPILDQLKI